MAKHIVVQGPVEHDGAVYHDGDEVELSASSAEVLLAVGVVEPKPAGRKAKEAASKAAEE
jgi:hypothetical protein